MLDRDFGAACELVHALPNSHGNLRPYQREANDAIEQAIGDLKRTMLIAMATGTGKTFTMVNQVYRLMKSGVARRVLFLVDRRALAGQAVREFASFEPEPGLKFTKSTKSPTNAIADTPLRSNRSGGTLSIISMRSSSAVQLCRRNTPLLISATLSIGTSIGAPLKKVIWSIMTPSQSSPRCSLMAFFSRKASALAQSIRKAAIRTWIGSKTSATSMRPKWKRKSAYRTPIAESSRR
jgi:hypothetical protein